MSRFLEATSIVRRLSNRSRSRGPSIAEAVANGGKMLGGVAAPGISEENRRNIRKTLPFLTDLLALASQTDVGSVEAIPEFGTALTSAQATQPPNQASSSQATHSPSVVDIRIRHTDGRPIARLAKADTGSSQNFISNDTVLALGVDMIELKQHERPVYNNADGGTFQARGKVCIDWYAYGSARTRTTEFFVIKTKVFDVIFGEPFLLEQGLIEYHNLWVIQEDKNKDRSGDKTSQVASKEKQKQANEAERQRKKEDKRSKDQKGKPSG